MPFHFLIIAALISVPNQARAADALDLALLLTQLKNGSADSQFGPTLARVVGKLEIVPEAKPTRLPGSVPKKKSKEKD